jgi:hypothetical protein
MRWGRTGGQRHRLLLLTWKENSSRPGSYTRRKAGSPAPGSSAGFVGLSRRDVKGMSLLLGTLDGACGVRYAAVR